jgi:hypothetical protein
MERHAEQADHAPGTGPPASIRRAALGASAR